MRTSWPQPRWRIGTGTASSGCAPWESHGPSCPGTFASNVLYWLDRKNNAIFLPVGDGRDSFVDPRDIAAVAAALLTLAGQDGRIYEISGSEWLSFAQVAQKISRLTGKKASYHNIPEETAKQK